MMRPAKSDPSVCAVVDAALARAEAGDYGVCDSCGQPIAAERLAARPQARSCLTCASRSVRRHPGG